MATKIIQSKTYYTPFPREKSNNEVLKNSYSRKLSKNSTLINIPPSVTVSYMKKNPFYFDLKKKEKNKRPESSHRKTGYTIYENKKLQNLLKSDKRFLAPEYKNNKLSSGCEKIKIKQNLNNKLTQEEIRKILNKISIPPKKRGKVPKYIYEFRVREFIEREYERLVEEEKGYPKGTFKVWENDRLLILENLYIIKEELINELRLFPVDYYLRAIGIRNKRAEIEKRLDDIDFAIKIFELNDVYLKI
jgi:hypothetical protein